MATSRLEPRVVGAKHFAHPAGAQTTSDQIGAKARTGINRSDWTWGSNSDGKTAVAPDWSAIPREQRVRPRGACTVQALTSSVRQNASRSAGPWSRAERGNRGDLLPAFMRHWKISQKPEVILILF